MSFEDFEVEEDEPYYPGDGSISAWAEYFQIPYEYLRRKLRATDWTPNMKKGKKQVYCDLHFDDGLVAQIEKYKSRKYRHPSELQQTREQLNDVLLRLEKVESQIEKLARVLKILSSRQPQTVV